MNDPLISALSPDVLAALKQEHIAFLKRRLGSDEARQDWVASFRDGYAWVLGLKVADVVDPVALTDGVVKALTADSVKALFAPVARDIHRRVLATLKADTSRLGDYVPAQARLAIDDLLERSDLVPEHLIRNVLEQEAIEDLVRDILYDGLVEFNETANPFFADWGLPALVKRMPIGGGAILKSMGAMRGEFDKRLEPEIRKFLLAFSRKAKTKLADMIVKKGDDPNFIALRKNVVSFLYSQSMKELLLGIDDKASGKAENAAEHIALETLRREEPRRKLKAALDTFLAEQGDRTLGEAEGRERAGRARSRRVGGAGVAAPQAPAREPGGECLLREARRRVLRRARERQHQREDGLMASGATMHHVEVALSDVDRGVYESLDLRVAQHPSESMRYMLTRTLAYCLSYEEGIAFSKAGIADTDEPPIAVKDPTGVLLAWVDIGNPSAERLHKASKAARRVALFSHYDLAQLRKEASTKAIHKVDGIEVYCFAGAFLDSIIGRMQRNTSLEVTRNDGQLYVAIAGETFETPLPAASLVTPS